MSSWRPWGEVGVMSSWKDCSFAAVAGMLFSIKGTFLAIAPGLLTARQTQQTLANLKKSRKEGSTLKNVLASLNTVSVKLNFLL